ncbi:acyltransferase GLAUCE-like [Andrographis paniculata]|uniref:acyltransferase GLAUCE-like n=1 Tax=Andrographis paniculata TaxID=175694 RepID=UPI0021E7F20D|nr:acyltransferase GLAUCE-like [Andrographis paniculata]
MSAAAAILSPNPAVPDLKLTVHESTLVSPPPPSHPKSLFLSNIDQILNYSVPTAYFFPSNPDFPPQVIAQRLRTALQRLLLTYDFMAGRLKLNQELQGRLEIDCNAAGVGFVVASSELSLADLGDVVRPNPAFQHLAPETLDNIKDGDQPLFTLQVTSFKCGGFAIGMSSNHILLDGMSARAFKQNLASQAFEDERPLAVIPCLDRRLLVGRSPPQVDFQHQEFFIPETAPNSSGPPVFDCQREELEFRVFRLTPADIKFLKEVAAADADADGRTNTKISSYSVATALIWRCKALSSWKDGDGDSGSSDRERVSRFLNVIDIRARLSPALPESYCGNAVLVAQSSEKCEEMEKGKGSFGKLVEMVAEGPMKIGDSYVRSAIDWLGVNRGLPYGDYMVSSWLRLGFGEVEFPWGKARHCGPMPNHRKDICWMFPTPTASANEGQGAGHAGIDINALVALPPPEMERFQAHFLDFFSNE